MEDKTKVGKWAFWAFALGIFIISILSVLIMAKPTQTSDEHILSVVKSHLIEYNPNMPKIYNGGTLLTTPRVAVLRISLTASPQSVDISSCGFTNVYAVIPQGENNTNTINAMPNVVIKSFTSTSVTVNALVANNILGLGLLGLTTPSSYTGMFVDLVVIGQ